MIRKTLSQTRAATWAIHLSAPCTRNLPVPTGTGFFVSADGWFITAAHVVTDDESKEIRRADIANGHLSRTPQEGLNILPFLKRINVEWFDLDEDIAICKLDWSHHVAEMFKMACGELPFVRISRRKLEEGAPVYSFGYPLSELLNFQQSAHEASGETQICPRTTSAIVSSTEQGRQLMDRPDIDVIVIDKALNFGNSGGPLVATETGFVHGVCSGFHGMSIPQSGIVGADGNFVEIEVPSLYGYASTFANLKVLAELERIGIEIDG